MTSTPNRPPETAGTREISVSERELLEQFSDAVIPARPKSAGAGEHINCEHDPEGADGNPFAAMICAPSSGGAPLIASASQEGINTRA